jgi:non-ribosomal peptide synthetase component E (peptide arylation enzyme)
MVKPTRFTQEMYDEYFAKGLWTMDTTSDLWDRYAQMCPTREAFVDSKRRLNWFQMKAMSDSLAMSLRNLGVGDEKFIFILLPNRVESFIMRAACEKAGILCGTALMTIRENEIAHITKNFDVTGIAIPLEYRRFNYFAAVNQMRPSLPKLKHVFLMGEEIPDGVWSIEEMMFQHPPEKIPAHAFQDTRIKATDVSVIGFTSGTTGTPKGAEHIQCARMAMARCWGELPKINENDVVLNIISPVAGLSSGYCYNGTAALVNAKVVLSDAWSPENTFRLIEKEKATILLAVPAQLAQIARQTNIDQYDLRSLRCICTSTAPLHYNLAQEIEEIFRIPVLNSYGQFDGGTISGVSIDDPPEVRRSTVGKPFRDNIIHLVDDNGKEVPFGEVGEVVYTGPSTSSGYYKDLEATLKIWGTLGKEGRCRSGDLAKFDPHGNLILVGRKKDMIIRGGQNIYPAEVEGILLTHPKIKSIAIVSMPDPIMGEKCCAYVTLNKGEQFTFEEMISFLKTKKIANYKLPERLEIREELPLRGEQKVAKALLCEDIIQKLKAEGKM